MFCIVMYVLVSRLLILCTCCMARLEALLAATTLLPWSTKWCDARVLEIKKYVIEEEGV